MGRRTTIVALPQSGGCGSGTRTDTKSEIRVSTWRKERSKDVETDVGLISYSTVPEPSRDVNS